ncbi:MAG: TIGR02300 family protein [Rhodospirillaceae bacterium]
MAKVDLGMKLTCESCGARFYDLNKQPGVCPKCGTANARPVIFKASRRPSAEDREKAASLAAHKAPPKAADDDEDVAADDSDDEDEDVIEDTSDLGEDDDDVEVPVEKDEG